LPILEATYVVSSCRERGQSVDEIYYDNCRYPLEITINEC